MNAGVGNGCRGGEGGCEGGAPWPSLLCPPLCIQHVWPCLTWLCAWTPTLHACMALRACVSAAMMKVMLMYAHPFLLPSRPQAVRDLLLPAPPDSGPDRQAGGLHRKYAVAWGGVCVCACRSECSAVWTTLLMSASPPLSSPSLPLPPRSSCMHSLAHAACAGGQDHGVIFSMPFLDYSNGCFTVREEADVAVQLLGL